ncbi:MAG: Cytochrome c family protein [Candidatus Beckwithbacteria bacterium GW2011_GWB1_47_15]|uniref:Cytochrome c family protein n=1 Tax=Candidatus Beckwithbacteria bacterium GW2011_GWB1_47_15 TaxID=1618371 RepID=A0A0G1RVE3_9BACT|nr:MAG: Cytochrome c family protein [Candidatus Beckwithbacteria bacterium GW2011_GWB1_47_15]
MISSFMKSKKILVLLVLLFVALLGLIDFVNQKSIASRQAEIRATGARVMPFDLSKTTYIFDRTDTGGVQQVKVKKHARSVCA